MELSKLLDSTNIAEHLDDDKLIEIGKDVVEGYDSDLASRKPWEADLKNWTELALQVTHEKTFPWPNAANIKYPLLSTAAMQFAARTYPYFRFSTARNRRERTFKKLIPYRFSNKSTFIDENR
jgi:chaperonin GroES